MTYEKDEYDRRALSITGEYNAEQQTPESLSNLNGVSTFINGQYVIDRFNDQAGAEARILIFSQLKAWKRACIFYTEQTAIERSG